MIESTIRHRTIAVALLASLAAACSDDDPPPDVSRAGIADAGVEAGPDSAPAAPPLYAIMYEVFSDMGSDSYLSLINSLDVKDIDITRAREYPGGRAFLATHNGWVFVGDATTPLVTKYSVAADGALQEQGKLSFANYGLTAGNLDPWNVTFISNSKAYLFDYKEATTIIWNPTTMEITGEIKPPPELVKMGVDLDGSPAVVRGNRLYRSFFFVYFKTATYATDHFLASYDIVDDKLLELVPETRCPAPGNLVHKDEQGNFYFGNWIWPVSGTLMRGAPKSCVLKLPAGSDRYDPQWTLPYAELAGGREGAIFSYFAGGKGLMSVFLHEMTSFDDKTDPWDYAGESVWQIWNVDVQQRTASPLAGIPLNTGAFTPVSMDGRQFVMVPGKDWESTQLYEIKDGAATPAFAVRGWTYQFVKVR
jgi:hypothetical protein